MDYTASILSLTEELISKLGFPQAVDINVEYDPQDNNYQVSLQTADPALLIGYHGESLAALQLVLNQHIRLQAGEWLNLSLNVNDYKERRETSLHAIADSVVSKVLATHKAHNLPPMPANERRLVHMYLAQNTQVSTESQGVGRNRFIVVSPK